MIVPIFDLGGVKVTKIGPGTICVKAGHSWIYLTYEELADIAEAVAQHPSAAEPFFTEEDLAAGRRAGGIMTEPGVITNPEDDYIDGVEGL